MRSSFAEPVATSGAKAKAARSGDFRTNDLGRKNLRVDIHQLVADRKQRQFQPRAHAGFIEDIRTFLSPMLCFGMLIKTLVLLLLANTEPMRAANPPNPEAFVHDRYAQYTDKLMGPKWEETYSPGLIAMLKADQKKAGGEGAFDSDQLCQCQDWDGLRVISVKLIPHTSTTADADVVLKVFKARADLTRVRLRLVLLQREWRIDDVTPQGGQGMRETLRTAKY